MAGFEVITEANMPDDIYTDDPLKVCLREVNRVPPLPLQEELRCIEYVRASDEMAEVARTRLVEASLRHVISVAEIYRTDRVHILDLIEQGNKGLLVGVDGVSGGVKIDHEPPLTRRPVVYLSNALDTSKRVASGLLAHVPKRGENGPTALIVVILNGVNVIPIH